MKFILALLLLVGIASEAKRCPIGQQYLENGPGPFCYATCW